jgi:hypothetical protein
MGQMCRADIQRLPKRFVRVRYVTLNDSWQPSSWLAASSDVELVRYSQFRDVPWVH